MIVCFWWPGQGLHALVGLGAAYHCDNAIYVDMLFIHWTEEEVYERPLATIFRGNLDQGDDAPVTHSLDYVTFRPLYVTLLFLTNFDCRL